MSATKTCRTLGAVSGTLLVLACGGTKPTPTAPTGGEALAVAPAVGDQTAPAEPVREERVRIEPTDTVWDLAPADTTWGFVVSPDGGNAIRALLAGIRPLLAARKNGDRLLAELAGRLPAGVGAAIFEPGLWDRIGLDPALGGAAFFAGDSQGYLLQLPLTDRAAFRAFTGAKVEAIDGAELDRLGSTYCGQAAAGYLCADSPARIVAADTAGPGPMAAAYSAIPADAREQILGIYLVDASRVSRPADASDRGPSQVAVGVKLAAGDLTLRVWVDSTLNQSVRSSLRPAPGAIAKRTAATLPTATMRATLPVTETLEQAKAWGMDLPYEALQTLDGEIVAYAPAAADAFGFVEVGGSDSDKLAQLVDFACQLARGLPSLQRVRMQGARCLADFLPASAGVSTPGVPAQVPLALEASKSSLVVRLGTASKRTKSPPPLGAVARDLVAGEWSSVIWGRGIELASMPGLAQQLPAWTRDWQVLWLLSHVSELGLGAVARSDGLLVLLHIGTYAADPPAALRAYQAAVNKGLDGKHEAAAAALTRIARKHPGTRAGSVRALGPAGAMLVAFTAGVTAAIAIPAFNKYMARAKAQGAPTEGPVAEIEALASRACDCKQIECARGVWGDFKQFMAKYKDVPGSTADLQRVEKAAAQAFECLVGAGLTPDEISEFTETL